MKIVSNVNNKDSRKMCEIEARGQFTKFIFHAAYKDRNNIPVTQPACNEPHETVLIFKSFNLSINVG